MALKTALRISAAALACSLAQPGALQAQAALPQERTPERQSGPLATESGLFQDRLERPWNHFLWDGQHAFVAGREFYRATEMDTWLSDEWPSGTDAFGGAAASETPSAATGVFLWPGHPWQSLRPERGWLKDTATVTFRGKVGNEVGDPLLGELTGVSGSDNHTPITSGGASVAPTRSLRLFAGLDQNDHFSFRTYPHRIALVGEGNREKLSYVGGNLPPKSQAQLGAAWTGRRSMLTVNANRGWWWTASPVSGATYPWEGVNGEMHFQIAAPSDPDARFDAVLILQDWSLNRAGDFHDSHFRRYEAGVGIQGSFASREWRLETGYARRVLESDSAFRPVDVSGFPWAFRYRRDWERAFSGHPLEAASQGTLAVRDGLFSAQHAKGFRAAWGRNSLAQNLKAYYHRRLQVFAWPREFFPEDTAMAVYKPGKHARGLAASADYARVLGGIRLGAGLAHAWDWQAPLFRGEIRASEAPERRGMLAGSDHVLANASGTLSLSGSPEGAGDWDLEAGMRKFYGRDADNMEYLPSPWWLGGGGSFAFPSDLRVKAKLHYLGPKRVRGWGPELRVPAHWENNLGLSQALFGDRLELTVSLLHAFGEEVLEHPGGNPLRFRLLVGCRGAF